MIKLQKLKNIGEQRLEKELKIDIILRKIRKLNLIIK